MWDGEENDGSGGVDNPWVPCQPMTLDPSLNSSRVDMIKDSRPDSVHCRFRQLQ